ncbi:MAG: 4Fe-4S binding protein [candidate division WOR-3 bacterium]
MRTNWNLCTRCGKCVFACPADGPDLFGQEMTGDHVLGEVEQNSTFYRESRGGIRMSGGECLLQEDFVLLSLLLVVFPALIVYIPSAMRSSGSTHGVSEEIELWSGPDRVVQVVHF